MVAVTRHLAARDRALVWLAAAGPPLAWALHFGTTYWYAEGACANETAISSVEPVVLALTAAFAAVVAAAAAAGVSLLRRLARGELTDPRERLRFMAVVGLIGAVLFGFAIVLEGIQVLSLSACAEG